MKYGFPVLLFSVLCLGGCSTIRADDSAGVRDLTIENQLEYVDVAGLVLAESGGIQATPLSPPNSTSNWQAAINLSASETRSNGMKAAVNEDLRLATAIAYFYATVPMDDQPLLRNDIQDHIIAAANQRCHHWRIYFSKQAEDFQFWSGTVGSAASAAATALTDSDAKSAFSATSSLANAAGTNFSDSYLQSKSLAVIYEGIDTKQQSILATIKASRTNADGVTPAPTSAYTLSKAISDALVYHAACSVVAGLQQAADALAPTAPQTSQAAQAPSNTGQVAEQAAAQAAYAQAPAASPADIQKVAQAAGQAAAAAAVANPAQVQAAAQTAAQGAASPALNGSPSGQAAIIAAAHAAATSAVAPPAHAPTTVETPLPAPTRAPL